MSGCFISGGAVIGSNCIIFQQVTIGSNTLNGTKFPGAPQIGSNCYIGAGAKIIGGIIIGDNCRIGANAVVTQNVPSNSTVVSKATKVIEHEIKPDNRFFRHDMHGAIEFYENGNWINDND